MRLVIFSPLAASSAIGRVTRLVVTALAEQGHEVVVVRSEDDRFIGTEDRADGATVVRWDAARAVRGAVEAADGIVYQIGNHFGFHRGCLEWLPRSSGIVCLHDYFLGGLFLGWAERHRSEAGPILRAWYGDDVAEQYFSFGDPVSFIDQTYERAPLTEWVASMAQGIVTHSSVGLERVLASCPGPVRVVPLPYDAPGVPERLRRGMVEVDHGFTVLTVGHVNANKRAVSVIRAIGESERLRSVTLYRLVGRIEPEMAERLQDLAATLGVDVSISGEVTDEALREALHDADVVCSLRLPALETASASTIEAMLYGKAVIVMDTGFYRDLPASSVRKVSPEREIADLRRELESLYADPAARIALGEAAEMWAKRTFRADNYAANLIELCSQVAAAAPVREASRYFAEVLVDWGVSERWIASSDLLEPLRLFEDGPPAAR